MILQELARYYRRKAASSSNVAPEGFENKEIPFVIVLDKAGKIRSAPSMRVILTFFGLILFKPYL